MGCYYLLLFSGDLISFFYYLLILMMTFLYCFVFVLFFVCLGSYDYLFCFFQGLYVYSEDNRCYILINFMHFMHTLYFYRFYYYYLYDISNVIVFLFFSLYFGIRNFLPAILRYTSIFKLIYY